MSNRGIISSTPVHSFKASLINSPTTSNISKQSSTIFHESDEQSNYSKLTHSRNSSSIGSETVDLKFDGERSTLLSSNLKYEIRRSTKEWSIIKPQHKHRLYHKIVNTDEDGIEDLAAQLVSSLKDNNDIFLKALSQLILDIADYQHFEMPDITYNKPDIRKFMKTLTNAGPQNYDAYGHCGHSYIATCKTSTTNAILAKVFYLLKEIIQLTHNEELLYRKEGILKFFIFLRELSSSEVACLRHTVTVISLQMITKITELLKIISDDTSSILDEEKKNTLQDYLKFIFVTFERNCCLNCNKMYIMRLQCTAECGCWIESLPNMHFDRCIEYILKSITDDHVDVRCTGLEVLIQLLPIDNLKETYFAPKLNYIMKRVCTRLIDIKNKIRLKATEICTIVLTEYDYIIAENYQRLLKQTIFQNYTPIAVEGCNFYIHALAKYHQNDNDAVVNSILSYLKKRIEYLPLFVEAALSVFPLFRNFEEMFYMLKNEKVLANEDVFLIIILQSAIQLINGKSALVREQPRTEVISSSESMDICKTILNNLPYILDKYKFHELCLNEVKEFLLLLENRLLSGALIIKINNILDVLKNVYFTTNDVSLLKIISEVVFTDFSKLRTTNNEVTDRIKQKLITYLHNINNLLITSENISNDIFNQMTDYYCKIAFAFKKVDLHQSFEWQKLYESLELISDDMPFDLIKSVLDCINSYLTWKLRYLMKNSIKNIAETEFETLNDQNKAFLSTVINKLHAKFQLNVKLLICDSILDLFLNYKRETMINNNESRNPNLNIINVELNTSDQDLLYRITSGIIFQNTNIKLEKRKDILIKYLNVIMNGQLCGTYMVNIFKYFDQRFEEYGLILTSYFQMLTKPQNKEYVTVGALIKLYEDSPESNEEDIKNLMVRFNSLLSGSQYKTVLEIIIKYVTSKKEFSFLEISNKIIFHLIHDDCLPIISLSLKELAEYMENQHVKTFMENLNTRYEKVPIKRKRKAKK